MVGIEALSVLNPLDALLMVSLQLIALIMLAVGRRSRITHQGSASSSSPERLCWLRRPLVNVSFTEYGRTSSGHHPPFHSASTLLLQPGYDISRSQREIHR